MGWAGMGSEKKRSRDEDEVENGQSSAEHPLTGRPYSAQFHKLMEKRQKLPCWDARSNLLKEVKKNQVVIFVGETGSGKTTQIPQFLLSAGYATEGKMIAVTQPRRVAAMSVAARVAQEADVELGQEVGYLIRFEDVTSEKTLVKYMTDGMLLRECTMDPKLSKYSVVILDEAHERTLSTDILFGLIKKVMVERPELRILVMSATLEAEKFVGYWDDAPLLKVPGRMYPVESFFTLKPEKDYWEAAIDTCVNIHAFEGTGDILLFLTGEAEIETACIEIASRCEGMKGEVCVLPLYGSLPMQQQKLIFKTQKDGVRRIIVATNIAETSVTIDGVVFVIDPGFSKQNMYNPRTHTQSLLVSPISRAAAMQRAGRAGRTRPGKCFRLYTQESFDNDLSEATYPEILRSNLSSVVLTLKKLGVDDLVHFDFMDPPSPETMMRALDMLHDLEALGDDAHLTDHGEKMAEIPVDPELAKVMLVAPEYSCGNEVVAIVAMLSVPPPYQRGRNSKAADKAHQAFAVGSGDHLTLLNTFASYKDAESKQNFCWESFLQERALKQAQSIQRQLAGIMTKLGLPCDSPSGKMSVADCVRKAFVAGFFMQCAHLDIGGKHYRTVKDSQTVDIHPSSFLQHKPEWVMYHETVVTEKSFMRNCSALTAEMLIEVVPRHYHPENCKGLGEEPKKSLEKAWNRMQSRKDTTKVKKKIVVDCG